MQNRDIITTYVVVSRATETTEVTQYYHLPNANYIQMESALLNAGFRIKGPMDTVKYVLSLLNRVRRTESWNDLGSFGGGSSRQYFLPGANRQLITQTLESAGFKKTDLL